MQEVNLIRHPTNIRVDLHGVGVSVVNALSTSLDLRIFQNGQIYEQHYERGKPIDTLTCRRDN